MEHICFKNYTRYALTTISPHLSNSYATTTQLCLLKNFRPFLKNHFLINAIGNTQWFAKADKSHIFRVFNIVTAYTFPFITVIFGK